RRRTQQRLRWHLHALDPTYVVPLRRLSRSSQLETVSRWLARRPKERLPRTQTRRMQKPTLSHPLPQTTARPCRLQHTQNEPHLDIGATLAQLNDWSILLSLNVFR